MTRMHLRRETLALCHSGILIIASAWLLGGKIEWAKPFLAALATPAIVLLAWEIAARRREFPGTLKRLFLWLSPMLLLGAIVICSAFNPNHAEILFFDTKVLRPIAFNPWIPSSAAPAHSLLELWLLGGLYLASFNLAFCVHSRARLRLFLFVLVVNAATLAVMGTLQKFFGASGPLFGRFVASNPTWFASFTYHNHWGAFATLHVAAALGLAAHAIHQARNSIHHSFSRSIGPASLCCALIIALGVPLSTSRSCSFLVGLLLFAAAVIGLSLSLRLTRRPTGERKRWLFPTMLAAIVAIAAATTEFAGPVIKSRWQDTRQQYEKFRDGSTRYGRSALYRDTWHLARDHIVWGTGLETYQFTFQPYYSFTPGPDRLWSYYTEAHNDWLQSLAEIGMTGSALLLLAITLPLAETARGRRPSGGLAAFLAAGCGLIAAYAFFEFPMASPPVVATWWSFFFVIIRYRQLTPSF